MSGIYDLTSSHIYGLIYRVVDNENGATRVLKAVYRRLWEQRHEFERKSLEPLDWLRATAHRYAMDYKTAKSIICDTPAISQKKSDGASQQQKLDLSEEEKMLLKHAYLETESLADLSARFNNSEERIAGKLELINQKIKRFGQ
ncbi:hypothetical protein [Litorimonas haliclonae]|uniref:hypothetical protein n=1 Tax=Litorimonas haliclonae TaxID=2081977 RepID=UPI0039F09C54